MKLAVSGRHKAVRELALILGFEPSKTSSLTIVLKADSYVHVNAVVLLEEEQLESFTEVFRKYDLVEIGTEGDESDPL